MNKSATFLVMFPVSIAYGYALGYLTAACSAGLDKSYSALDVSNLQYWWAPAGAMCSFCVMPFWSYRFIFNNRLPRLLQSMGLAFVLSGITAVLLAMVGTGLAVRIDWMMTFAFNFMSPIVFYYAIPEPRQHSSPTLDSSDQNPSS